MANKPTQHPVHAPATGPRTFQAAGTDVERKFDEIRERYAEDDWEGANAISDTITPYERNAHSTLMSKLGGGPGGSTFERGEVFCEEYKNEK